MRYTKLAISLVAALALSACVTTPEPKIEIRYVEVPVMVATGCIAATGRPEAVKPLKEKYTADEWLTKPPGAKASEFKAQAGERMNYQDADSAATAGCK